MTINAVKNGLNLAVRFLNHPPIKEGIKNVASVVAFSFGLLEAYDLYRAFQSPTASTETAHSGWVETASKAALTAAKISLILSAITSRLGVFLLSNCEGFFFSGHRLEQLFGPNAAFAINPWHPRHILSIAATILALPASLQSIYYWTCKRPSQNTSVQSMALLNTVFSRPVQHLGNQLCQKILRR